MKKTIGILMAAVLLLTGCGASARQMQGSVPEEADVSAAPSEAPEETSSGLAIPAGTLRVYYLSDSNLSLLFSGSQLVCQQTGQISLFEREDGTSYIALPVQDGYALYDGSGALLLEDLPYQPTVCIGKWLFCPKVSAYEEENVPSGCVVDLDTLQRRDFDEEDTPYQLGEDYICINNYGEEYSVRILRISDLSEVERLENCLGYLEADLPGYLCLSEEDTSALYTPGKRYDGYQHSCGENRALLQSEDGMYRVLDVQTGQILYQGDETDNRHFLYYTDAVQSWIDDQYNHYIAAPCYPEPQQISYASASWHEGDDLIEVSRLDDSVDLLSPDGELLFSRAPADGNMIYYIGYGCVQEQTSYLKDSTGGALYWLDGRSLTFDRYQSVSWFSGSDQLLCGSYLVGNRYLYDLLDTDGNVLMEGLNDYYSYTADPDGFMMVRKGFSYGLLDADCSWLWKESIFQSAADETDNY